MARMRTIKPEACTSESLAEVDRAVRWTFAALWTHCDDEGRAAWNPRLVKAALYPLDDTVTVDVVRADIAELVRVGAVCMYTVDGREYLHVPAWSDHQHPNRKVDSKLPPCPATDHSTTAHAQRSEDALPPQPQSSPVVVVGVVGGEVEVAGAGANPRGATALALVESSTSAQTIVAEWIERCEKRPPSPVIGQTAKCISSLLAEGIDPDDVRRGVGAWMAKGLHPSVLPSVVNEVMNSRPRPPRAQQETDDMFARAAQRMGVTS